MTNYFEDLDLSIQMALTFMLSAAEKMNVSRGVAAIFVEAKDGGFPHLGCIQNNVFLREPDLNRVNDLGTNYFGLVWQKIAYMMSHRKNSGHTVIDDLKKGETHFRGGLRQVIQGYVVYVAYSGASEPEDVEIAKAGMEMMEISIKKKVAKEEK